MTENEQEDLGSPQQHKTVTSGFVIYVIGMAQRLTQHPPYQDCAEFPHKQYVTACEQLAYELGDPILDPSYDVNMALDLSDGVTK